MFIKYLLRLKIQHLRALREQKGQSLIIFVFAILGLIAMMGLALDLGLVYIERVRVSRTTDAASLAAVVELPFEEEAIRRAAEYIELNGYTQENTEIRVRGCIVTGSGNLANVGEKPGESGDTVDGNGAVYGGNNMVRVEPSGPRVTSGYVYQPALTNPPKAIFVIDTLAFQPVDRNQLTNAVETPNKDTCNGAGDDPSSLFGTANKVRVSGQVMVDMNFMQFFGFRQVPVSDEAVGENVTNLDVMVVFDVSGSMIYETNCFGCWNEDSGLSADIMNNPFPTNGYPDPLDYEGNDIFWGGDSSGFGTDFTKAGDTLCSAAPTPATSGGYHYLVHEAEFYSGIYPQEGWKFQNRQAGQGFWVIQRTNRGSNGSYVRPHSFVTYSQGSISQSPHLQGAAYNIECWSQGECWKSRAATLGLVPNPANNNPPYVEYDFTIPSTGWGANTHIWIRAIGGNTNSQEWNGEVPTTQPANWRQTVYWQVDDLGVRGGDFANLKNMGGGKDVPSNSDWRWVKIGGFNPTLALAPGQHKLKLYQGSAGFNLDKIIITDNDDGDVGTAFSNGGSKYGGGTIAHNINNVLKLNGGEGPDATPGSATREACNMCNPAFGQTVSSAECTCRQTYNDFNPNPYTDLFGAPDAGTDTTCFSTAVLTPTNNLADDLFHDVDPLRSAQEAVKNFAARLDPKFDQIGVVAFSSGVDNANRVKLQCLKYEQNNGGALGQKGCFDPSVNHPDSTTGGPISYTRAIQLIEDQTAGGTTNISEGMREGLEELGLEAGGNTNVNHGCTTGVNDKEACDRQGAARRVLVLMTDGAPNQYVFCSGSYHWRGKVGAGTRPYDCAMFFAKEAAERNVVVYTIGIGPAVDRSLLTAMAEGKDPDPVAGDDGIYFNSKGGKYFPAAKPSDLDAIFEQILENIYVRIVG